LGSFANRIRITRSKIQLAREFGMASRDEDLSVIIKQYIAELEIELELLGAQMQATANEP
jgi:hypothetical protein